MNFGPDFDFNQFMLPGMIPGGQSRPFGSRYKCYSIAMYQQSHASDEKVAEMENGGKILLPQSALDYLTRLHIEYPMLFKLTNTNSNNQRITHAGVLEFHHEEGKCYIPYWMMRNLLLNEGELVQVDYASLPTATYMKLKPQSPDFLDITNPRAVLELKLRNFSCLTKSDIIAINYNNKIYEFLVEELKPANAVSIIECDSNVDFSPPVGFKEHKKESSKESKAEENHYVESESVPIFMPFSGKGFRSDGKEKLTTPVSSQAGSSQASAVANSRILSNVQVKRGIPNYDYKPGKLTFIHAPAPKTTDQNGSKLDENAESFKAFSGKGQSLKGFKAK